MNIYNKIKYFLKRPEIIIYDDNLFLEKLSKNIFKKELFFSIDKKKELINFLIKYSKKPIVILNNQNSMFEKIISFKDCSFLLNSDYYRKKDEYSNIFTYGARADADFNIGDINIDSNDINFKLSYKGSSVPFWIKGKYKEEEIESLAGIIGLLVLKGMNLVEISEKMKEII